MSKYKSDIAESAANMMQLPDTLEGMLQDIHGQKEVESPVASQTDMDIPKVIPTVEKKPKKQKQDKTKATPAGSIHTIEGDELWASFSSLCEQEDQLPKNVGKDSVGGYTTQTLVNAILRSFILHYKKEFNKYKITEKSLL